MRAKKSAEQKPQTKKKVQSPDGGNDKPAIPEKTFDFLRDVAPIDFTTSEEDTINPFGIPADCDTVFLRYEQTDIGLMPVFKIESSSEPDENLKFNEAQEKYITAIDSIVQHFDDAGVALFAYCKTGIRSKDVYRGKDVFDRLYIHGLNALRAAGNNGRCYAAGPINLFRYINILPPNHNQFPDVLKKIIENGRDFHKNNTVIWIVKEEIKKVSKWQSYADIFPVISEWLEYLTDLLTKPDELKSLDKNEETLGDTDGIEKPTLDFQIRLLREIPGYAKLFESCSDYREYEFLALALNEKPENIRAEINGSSIPKVNWSAEAKKTYIHNTANYGTARSERSGTKHYINQMAALKVIELLSGVEDEPLIAKRENTKDGTREKHPDLSLIHRHMDKDRLEEDFKYRKKTALASAEKNKNK